MITVKRLVQLLLAVTTLVAVLSTSATARFLEILNAERGFRVFWAPFEFRMPFGTVRCNVTLEGSFETWAYEKVTGSTLGAVTNGSVSGCTGGGATVLTGSLPWSLKYESFAGTLPNITSERQQLVGAAFQISEAFITCLARSEVRTPLKVTLAATRERGGLLELPTWRLDETTSFSLTGAGCEAARATFRGTGNATVRGETAKTTLRLVEALPTITFTPSLVTIVAGEQIAERQYRIRNLGAATDPPIRIRSIGLADSVRFRVEDAGGRCTGRQLAGETACLFEVNYNEAFNGERPKTTLVEIFWEQAPRTAGTIAN